MKLLFPSVLLLSGCATLFTLTPKYEYCGNVDTLAVHVKDGAFMDCKEAMQVTNEAYELLWQKAAGPLNESWRVEYMWGAIDATEPWAKIYPDEHRILVQSAAPHSIFHELLHDYITETHTGGRNQHRKMCANTLWRQLEIDFDVKPYCHLIYQ